MKKISGIYCITNNINGKNMQDYLKIFKDDGESITDLTKIQIAKNIIYHYIMLLENMGQKTFLLKLQKNVMKIFQRNEKNII